jgi:DNA-binding transcriptional regulator YhcF (GntR family)
MKGPSAIFQFKVRQGEALYRQVAKHVRSLILAGDLPAGEKLPRMHDLAAEWNTNYFTVHTALTKLVGEGLLERKARLGTFVRRQNKGLHHVGIYYGDEILIKHERAFYRALHAQLLQLLQKEGISSRVFIDCRPKNQLREPLLDLSESIAANEIQGLIIPLLNVREPEWIRTLPIPTSLFSGMRADFSRIRMDFSEIMALACGALREQGCRTVGLIHPTLAPPSGKPRNDSLPDAFLRAIEKFGLETRKPWFRVSRIQRESQEQFGYNELHKLWALDERPEGLIVYPENVSRGVVLALLEEQVPVPEQLKLVLHKNENVDFLCPVQADWIVTQERDVAKALLQQLRDRFAGVEPHDYDVHHQLRKERESDPESPLVAAKILGVRGKGKG